MGITMYDIKRILNPRKDAITPTDDFRIIDSWTEYDNSKNGRINSRPLQYLCYELESIDPDSGEKIHYYKAIRFARVIRLPKAAKQSTALMDMQSQILSGVYEEGYNLVTIIANVMKPVALGLLYLYGIQGVGNDIEEAKTIAKKGYLGFCGMMQGTFRTLEMRTVNAEETEWLREKMYNMEYMTAIRGIPKASQTGEDAGNRGIGGDNLNPDSQGTLEELISGMSDYEYVLEILSTPVFHSTLRDWQRKTQHDMTIWNSQLQGTKSFSLSMSVPMMFSSNQSNSQGWNKGYSDARSVSYSQGESFSTSFGQSTSHGISETIGRSFGRTEGTSLTESIGSSHSVSNTVSQGTSFTQSIGKSTTIGNSVGTGFSSNAGTSTNKSFGTSQNSSFGTSKSDSFGVSSGSSHNVGTGTSSSHGGSSSTSASASWGGSETHSTTHSDTHSDNTSHSDGTNSSHTDGTNSSDSTNQSHTSSHSDSTSINESLSGENSFEVGMGIRHGSAVNMAGGNPNSQIVNAYKDTLEGHNNHQGSGSVNISVLGVGGTSSQTIGTGYTSTDGTSDTTGSSHTEGTSSSNTSGSSHTDTFGSSDGYSDGYSDSYGSTWGGSVSNTSGTNWSRGVSSNESWGTSQSTNQSQSVSQNQSLGYGTSTSDGYGESQSTGWSTNNSTSSSTGTSVSYSTGQSTSISQGETIGTSETRSVGKSYSESSTDSVSQGTSDSYGENTGVSQGVNTGKSTGNTNSMSFGTSGAYVQGVSSSMGLSSGIGYNKSYQWLDQSVKDILELLEFENERIKKALRGNGAFYTYVYLACPSQDALSVAQAVAKATWQNEYAMTQPLQILELTEEEQRHLLYRFAGFSTDVMKETIGGVEMYRYATILLPNEYVAYTHLPRISEGGVFAEVNDIPKFAVPSMMKGEIFMGTIVSAERFTMNNGYMTPYDYRIDESELMHGYFTGASRSGKTVAAMRFVAELSQIRRKKTGKRMRIVCMDPKQDWRTLARFVEPERFRFYSLGNTLFHPIKLNPLKIPRGVQPQIWIDGLIDIYCRAYGLLERGKQMMGETIYALYEEAGVFEACKLPNWEERVPELSAEVTFENVYKKMNDIKVRLEDPTNPKGRAGNDTRDAYARLLDRLQAFSRPFSIEHKLFGTSEGMGIDELIGADDVTILESAGLESTFRNFIFGVITSGFFKWALAHEGGYLAENQYETVLVIEEANQVLTGNDAAGTGGGQQFGMTGQSEFEQILDQAAGYGLFIIAITQKISAMPSSVIANSGLIFAGRLVTEDDINVVVKALGRDPRIDDRDVVKWFPRSPIGRFICKSSRTYDYKDAEPVMVQISQLNIAPPSNAEIEEILCDHRVDEILKEKKKKSKAS